MATPQLAAVASAPFPALEVSPVGEAEPEAAAAAEGAAPAVYWATCCLTRYLSHSLTERRRNSRKMARQTMPMQEPANMPVEVTFQFSLMKQDCGGSVS